MFVIFLVTVVFLFTGVLVDAGHAIDERTEASNIAGEAARKVAGDISIADLRAGKVVINAQQCWSEADQLVADYHDPAITVTACTVAGRNVTVSVAITYQPVLLTLGLTFTARATAVAHLSVGITTGS